MGDGGWACRKKRVSEQTLGPWVSAGGGGGGVDDAH